MMQQMMQAERQPPVLKHSTPDFADCQPSDCHVHITNHFQGLAALLEVLVSKSIDKTCARSDVLA